MDSRPTQVRDITVSGREWSGKGPAWDGPRLAPPLTKRVQVGFVSMCSWRSVGGRQTARWGWVSTNRLRTSMGRFVGDTRAGATAIAAVAVIVMTVGATALIGDHVWLVDQRDVLKSASDAASVATTLELNRQLNLQRGISDSDLKPLLEPVARLYIELNLEHLPPDRLELAINTLSVEVTYCGVGNTDCDDSEMGISRSDACDAAKAAGSEIFVVAAMAQALVSTPLARTLRDCSSEADNPDGTYVFVDNPTPEALRAAFADIANQLVTVRRVY